MRRFSLQNSTWITKRDFILIQEGNFLLWEQSVTGVTSPGQGAMGTKWSRGSSSWTRGRTSSLWGWRSPGPGCPGRLWSLLLWRYSSPAWTRSCAACCRWPCFGRRVGLDDPQRSLPTPTILWFCDGRYYLKKTSSGTITAQDKW